MQQETRKHRARTCVDLCILCALIVLCANCSRTLPASNRYYDIYVDGATEAMWDSSEMAEQSYANGLTPIPPGSGNDVPFTAGADSVLLALKPSTRHGSDDKRFLALDDTTPSHVLAAVSLVKGVQYIKDSVFKAGWIPLAIVTVFDSTHGDSIVYPKLKLRGGKSWLFVRHGSGSEWAASLVRLSGSTIYQDSLAITAGTDTIPPAPAVRFMWKDHDEIIWGTCGGNCCKMAKSKQATQ